MGAEIPLHLSLAAVDGDIRDVGLLFAICSTRPARDGGWRMGGTLTPLTEGDGEALIEHCHVVTSRARLTESGRLTPGQPAGQPARDLPSQSSVG